MIAMSVQLTPVWYDVKKLTFATTGAYFYRHFFGTLDTLRDTTVHSDGSGTLSECRVR